jgi:hypothetical protein
VAVGGGDCDHQSGYNTPIVTASTPSNKRKTSGKVANKASAKKQNTRPAPKPVPKLRPSALAYYMCGNNTWKIGCHRCVHNTKTPRATCECDLSCCHCGSFRCDTT